MNKRKKKLTTMEYADAPSGFVQLYNYKEPFMPFKGGYGYEGVLLFDGKTDKVQCHLCGEWLHYLPNHLQKEHNIKAEDYKKKVGLRKNSVLISETTRAKLIASGLAPRLKNLRPGGKVSEETKAKIRATLLAKPRETQNELGTCPMQLLDRLRKITEKLGRVPKRAEMPFHETLIATFGSVRRAIEMAGLEPRKPGVNIEHWRTLEARVSDEYLIAMLKQFKEINGRKASYSDCRRGLLHSYSTYLRRFGSFEKAKKIAYSRKA